MLRSRYKDNKSGIEKNEGFAVHNNSIILPTSVAK